MSDAEWDADDFDVDIQQPIIKASDKWAGEDEDEDLKDDWAAEDDDDNQPKAEGEGAKKKKKSLKEIIAEKEEKKRKEFEERKRQEEEAKRKLTPEEILAEKLRQQKLVEDADLEMAKETFGMNNVPAATGIDSFEPITKEEFDKYGGMLKDRISQFERSTYYVSFLETLYRDLAVTLDVEDVKRLNSTLTAVYNEKTKALKNLKGKKKGKSKASISAGKDNNYEDYQADDFDAYDDFI